MDTSEVTLWMSAALFTAIMVALDILSTGAGALPFLFIAVQLCFVGALILGGVRRMLESQRKDGDK